MDYSPPGSSVHGDSPGKNTGLGYFSPLQGGSSPGDPGDLPNTGIKPGSPALQECSALHCIVHSIIKYLNLRTEFMVISKINDKECYK